MGGEGWSNRRRRKKKKKMEAKKRVGRRFVYSSSVNSCLKIISIFGLGSFHSWKKEKNSFFKRRGLDGGFLDRGFG